MIDNIMEVFDLFIEQVESEEFKELIKEIKEMYKEKEELKDKLLSLETERDILKSNLSDVKADIRYLLENGESIYIRNKYKRGDKE